VQRFHEWFGKQGCLIRIGVVASFGVIVLCCAIVALAGIGAATMTPEQRVAVASTQTARALPPSATLTDTPQPTLTPSPTSTATATPEPTYTPTITPLPTATLKPAQVKQTAVQATVDAKQAAVKATAEAKQAATATIVALDTEYPEVDIRDLVKRPQRYKGQKFQVTGKVFTIREQVDDGLFGTGETITQIQIWVTTPDGSKEAVVVLFNGTLEKVFEESTIIVYGVGEGTYEGVNGFGATITQPKVKAAFVRF